MNVTVKLIHVVIMQTARTCLEVTNAHVKMDTSVTDKVVKVCFEYKIYTYIFKFEIYIIKK